MEISNLTICRQDVIIVSDTDGESKAVNSNKKKKRKRKTTCIRNVKLKTVTVKRIVPYCGRQRCRYGQHYHRKTSMNTKYLKKETVPIKLKYKKNEAPIKETLCKSEKNDNDVNMVLNRDLCSPITVASSSDTYENVSSCSFNIMSSDSDELEDLINLTRKRMKNDSGNFNSFPIRKSVCATTTEADYQNISSDDDILNSSIHSMDTVLLYGGDTMAARPRTPEHLSQVHLDQHINNNNNNNIDTKLMCKSSTPGTNKLLQNKIPSLSYQNNNNMSPLYEISGKVFMEHYLNTSLI